MSDDQRRLRGAKEPLLLPAPVDALPTPSVEPQQVFALPGNAKLVWTRQDTVTVQHVSISPELAEARIKEAEARTAEANASAAIAHSEHAVQHEERSRQVKTVAVAGGSAIVIGTVGILLAQTNAQVAAIAGVVAVLEAIFAGVWWSGKKPKPPPKAPPQQP